MKIDMTAPWCAFILADRQVNLHLCNDLRSCLPVRALRGFTFAA
jgi:hypothetical protein